MPILASSPTIRGAPQVAIGQGYLANELAGFHIDNRTTGLTTTAEPSPVVAKATALPSNNGGRLNEDQNLPPAGPMLGQPRPKEAVEGGQTATHPMTRRIPGRAT